MDKVEAHGVMFLSLAIVEVVLLTLVFVTLLEISVPIRQEALYPERVTGILLVEMGDQHTMPFLWFHLSLASSVS